MKEEECGFRGKFTLLGASAGSDRAHEDLVPGPSHVVLMPPVPEQPTNRVVMLTPECGHVSHI